MCVAVYSSVIVTKGETSGVKKNKSKMYSHNKHTNWLSTVTDDDDYKHLLLSSYHEQDSSINNVLAKAY